MKVSRRPGIGLLLGAVSSLGLLMAPIAQAGWLPPVNLSEAGEHTGAPQVVLDAEGNATAVWETWNGEDTVIESAYRPAGKGWQTPVDISEASGETTLVSGEHDASYPQIAVDGQGDITVVWERATGADGTVVQAVYRPAGAGWGEPVDISEVGVRASAQEPWIVLGEGGNATAGWKRGEVIHSAYRPAGGNWQTPVDLSGPEAFVPKAAADAQGNATSVWMHYDGSKYVVQAAYAPANGSLQAPTTLSEAGEEGGDPYIAVNARGDALAVWDGHYGDNDVVREAYRPAGGSWQATVDVSGENEEIESLRVALDTQGDAVIAWAGSPKEAGGYDTARAAYRPAGGNWQAPTSLSENGGNAFPTDVAFDQAGNAVVVWERSDGTDNIAQAAYRPAGGGWQEPTSLSEQGRKSFDPMVVLDAEGEASAAQGDATVVWTSGQGEGCGEGPKCSDPTTYTVQAAGYDAIEHPETLEAPIVGEVGAPVAFAAASDDVWSPLLNFGDGTSEPSADATHTYAEPGEYTVTFSSTEVLGYRTSTHRLITIKPATGTTETDTPKSGQSGSGATGIDPAASGDGSSTTSSASSVSAKLLPLEFRFGLVRQSLRAVLRARAIRGVCYLSAPGVCTARGAAGAGHASFGSGGTKTFTIRLTRKALNALRRVHKLKITLTATASTTDHRSAATTSTLLVR